MENLKNAAREQFSRIRLYIRSLFKWLLLSFLVGILCGGLGSAFHIGVEYATELRAGHSSLLFLLPFGGLAIVAIYRFFSVEGQSTDSVIDEVQSGRGLKILLIPAIFLSTLLTHLFGQDLAVALGGEDGQALGDEEVAAVAGLHADDVVLIS